MNRHIEKAIVIGIGICFGVVLIAFIVAAFGTYICVGVILFTDAEDDRQMMDTLLGLWSMQTVAFVFGIICLFCKYVGYCDGIVLVNDVETDRYRRKKQLIYITYILVSEIVNVGVALFLFTNVGNNPLFLTTLLVLWLIQTVLIGIGFIGGCSICFFCPHYIRGTDEEKTPIMLEDQKRKNRKGKGHPATRG
jgi:hypothetical protein